MIFCKECILPNTRPNLFIDSSGICNACINHKKKNNTDWSSRKKKFERLVSSIKKKNKIYDCLVPVSGGKDSTWQIVKCLSYGLKPLAVTWKTPSRTIIGERNLNNLINLGVDHLDFQVNPKVESKFMLETFKKFGSTGIPMHMAIFNIPIKVALKFNIPLIVWGENSAQEYGGQRVDIDSYELNQDWFKKYGVTQGSEPYDWVSKKLSKKDLGTYQGFEWSDLKKNKIYSIFLGHFFKWDAKNSYEIARKNGFKSNVKNLKTGIYSHSDIDCDFISIHHWMKWYKFGFTRAMDNLSIEIREKRITKRKSLQILKKIKDQKPTKDIKKFCKFVGISEEVFFKIADKDRKKNIWIKKNNKWKIKNFII